MTVVINYTSQNYSIIATDTRLTLLNNQYRDDIIKLRTLPSPLGYVASIGFSVFHEKYKDLLSEGIQSISEIKTCLLKAASEVEAEFPEHIDRLQGSESYISYISDDGIKNSCTIGVVAPPPIQQENDILYVKENTFHIAFPLSYPQENREEIEEIFHATNDKELKMEEALILTTAIFNEISLNSTEVSSLCHIGIQELDGTVFRKYMIIDNVLHLLDNPFKGAIEIR